MLPIPGTATLARLEENVAAAGLELSDAQYELVAAASGPAAR
jgi:aryl-alcohol dehydrogenase-like predicted oxidoreductase